MELVKAVWSPEHTNLPSSIPYAFVDIVIPAHKKLPEKQKHFGPVYHQKQDRILPQYKPGKSEVGRKGTRVRTGRTQRKMDLTQV